MPKSLEHKLKYRMIKAYLKVHLKSVCGEGVVFLWRKEKKHQRP